MCTRPVYFEMEVTIVLCCIHTPLGRRKSPLTSPSCLDFFRDVNPQTPPMDVPPARPKVPDCVILIVGKRPETR